MNKLCWIIFVSFSILFTNFSSAEPFRVGVVVPLTGGLAEYGAASKNGIVLAQEEFPELLKSVEFVYEDDRYEGKMAISAYHKVRTIDKVDLIYLWGMAPVGAVLPVAESQKTPILAVTCQRDISKNREYAVRFCYQGQVGGKVLLEYLRSQGFKKLGIVKTEMGFINTVLEGLTENLKSDESLEVVSTHLFEDNDFRAPIEKLKRSNFDALGIFLSSGQISQFYRQMARLGLKIKTFGTDFFDSVTEINDAQGGMSGAVFEAPSTNPDFVSKYTKRFGNDLQIPWAANAYDFALMLGEHVVVPGEKLSAEEIIRRLRAVPPFKGASNSVYFQDDKQLGASFEFPVIMKRIENKQIFEIAPATK